MMDLFEAMEQRHSVRSYSDRKIEGEVKEKLEQKINECNEESGLCMQLVCNEPKAFDGFMAHYGKFSGITNYIAMVGPKGKDLEEKVGYYGEKLVLFAQQLGLNTCWVALTYSKIKGAFTVKQGEKLCLVIAIGYGNTNGVAHRSKAVEEVSKATGNAPEWFKKGVEASLLAPTAMNQQKYKFILDGNKVSAVCGNGFYTKIDLGIAKYHFELGAGKDNFIWE
ncbi:MAG: nitroreductase family protein [Lachnospira sp.]